MFSIFRNTLRKVYIRLLDWMIGPYINLKISKNNHAQFNHIGKENAKAKYLEENLTIGDNVKISSSFSIRNRQSDKSKIRVGDSSVLNGELFIMGYGGEIILGDYCYLGDMARVWSGLKVEIGDHVLISHNVNIIDTNSHPLNHLDRAEEFKRLLATGPSKTGTGIDCKEIIINDHVWINFNSTILKGVKIGKGAIIGPNSVVVKDVPPFTFVAGNPAKIIKQLEKCKR